VLCLAITCVNEPDETGSFGHGELGPLLVPPAERLRRRVLSSAVESLAFATASGTRLATF
jgi:hypothetical protein